MGIVKQIKLGTDILPDYYFYFGNYYREIPVSTTSVFRTLSGKIYKQTLFTKYNIEFGGTASGSFNALDIFDIDEIYVIGGIRLWKESHTIIVGGGDYSITLGHDYRTDIGYVPVVSDENGLLSYSYLMTDHNTILVLGVGVAVTTLIVEYYAKWTCVPLSINSFEYDEIQDSTGWGISLTEKE